MQYRTLGKTDLNASVLVLGTWAIGGSSWGGSDEADSIRAIHTALDGGINCIDTAPVYGKGLSEELVGKAVAGRRDSVIIATKAGLSWESEEGEFDHETNDGTRIYKNLRPAAIRSEVERSLKRLGTDYIDLLQTHWPDATTLISETAGTLLALKKEGKVRAIGASNVSPAQLDEYLAVGPLDVLQEMYSMIDRGHEAELFPKARAAGLGTLAYSPLAMGLLTGKIDPERTFPDDDIRSWSPRFTIENRRKIAVLLDRLEPFAERHRCSLAQLVIAWTAARPQFVTHVLCGARNARQAKENTAAGELTLSTEEIDAIEGILAGEELYFPHPYRS